jgi:hypothetical protein
MSTKKLKLYNSKHKYVLMIDGSPIALASSDARIGTMITYISGYSDGSNIADKKILSILKPYRELYLSEKQERDNSRPPISDFSVRVNNKKLGGI